MEPIEEPEPDAEASTAAQNDQTGAQEGNERQVVSMGDMPGGVGASTRGRRIPDNQRNTTPYLTKYERTRVIGSRATQIA